MPGVMGWETTASGEWCNRCQLDVGKKEDSAPNNTREYIHLPVLTQLIAQKILVMFFYVMKIHQTVKNQLLTVESSVVAFMAAGVVGAGGVIAVREGHIPKD